MPKKTAYSRSGAQRNKTKQKSFELVRPASDENVLDTVQAGEVEDSDEVEDVLTTPSDSAKDEKAAKLEVLATKGAATQAKKSSGTQVSTPVAVEAAASTTPAAATGSPKSAATRLASRRQAAQKAPRASSLITAEHYNYVRKDLIFILILAIIMFGTIIVLHFVLGS